MKNKLGVADYGMDVWFGGNFNLEQRLHLLNLPLPPAAKRILYLRNPTNHLPGMNPRFRANLLRKQTRITKKGKTDAYQLEHPVLR